MNCKEHDLERGETLFEDNTIFHSWICKNCNKYFQDACDECTDDYLKENNNEDDEL
jgi:hypothetical protein